MSKPQKKEDKKESSSGQNKDVEFLSKKKKKKLMEFMKVEKGKIKDFVKSIYEKNYNLYEMNVHN